MTYYNKLVKATPHDNSSSKSSNITFNVKEQPHHIMVQFVTLNGKGLVSYQSGNVSLTEGGVSKSIKLILQPVNTEKLNVVGDFFYLQNSRNNKYLRVSVDGYLTEVAGIDNQEQSSYIFNLLKDKGFYILQNQERYLNHDDTVLKFKNKSESIGVAKLFRIKLNYQLN